MKKLHKFVLKAYLGPLSMTFFIVLFVLVMQFLWKYIDDLVGKGLEWYIVLKLLAYAGASFIPLALPLAILLASLMTFGNLGEHYELVSMKAAGISLRKIMKPLAMLTFVIGVGAFVFSNNALPYINLKFKSLLYDIRQQKLTLSLKEGIFDSALDGYSIRVGRKSKDSKTLYDVMIYDHTAKQGNIKETTAKKGTLTTTSDKKYIIFTLFDGHNYEEAVNNDDYRIRRQFQKSSFQKQIIKFDLSQFKLTRTKEELFKNNYMMLNLSQLRLAIDSLDNQLAEREDNFSKRIISRYRYLPENDSIQKAEIVEDTANIAVPTKAILDYYDNKDKREILRLASNSTATLIDIVKNNEDDFQDREERINSHWITYHKTFTLSFACIILFFIGAPLGAIIRKGGLGLPIFISVVFFVFYHIITITGEKSAKIGELNVVVGTWMASVILLPIGIFLTYVATTDAPIMDIESWQKTLKKIFRFKNREKKQ